MAEACHASLKVAYITSTSRGNPLLELVATSPATTTAASATCHAHVSLQKGGGAAQSRGFWAVL